MKKTISILLVIALLSLSTIALANNSNGPATGRYVSNNSSVQDVEAMNQEYDRAIELLEPYVIRMDNGQFRFSENVNKLAEKLDIDKSIALAIRKGMQEQNRRVRTGELKTAPDLSVTVVGEKSNTIIYKDAGVFTLFSRVHTGGVTKQVHHWWGWFTYLNHRATTDLIWVLDFSAVTTAMLSPLFGPTAPLAIIAAGLTELGSLILGYYSNGCGVRIRFTASVPTGLWSQCSL